MIDLRSVFDSERGLRLKVAKSLGITPGAISQWDRVPEARVLQVSRLVHIPPHRLRPDIYPIPRKRVRRK